MLRKILFFSVVILVFFTLLAAEMTVDDVIKKNIEARGGYKKIKAVKSLKAAGKLLVQGMELPLTVRSKRPNYFRIDVSAQGQSLIQAYDGKMAWHIDPFRGMTEAQELTGEEGKTLAEDSDIDGPLIDYKKKGHKVELLGQEDVEGTAVYKLKLTLKSGKERFVFLDAEHFLPVKIAAKVQRQGNEYLVEDFTGNYKEVNGLIVPHSYEKKVNGTLSNQIIIDKIEMNVKIDNSIFKMPEKKVEEKKEEKKNNN